MAENPVALQLLLTGYFHLDWTWEYTTPEDAVAHFIAAEPRETLRSAQAELAELLETMPDHQIDRWLNATGCGYYPPGDQLSATDWLTQVDQQFRHALAGDPLWRP